MQDVTLRLAVLLTVLPCAAAVACGKAAPIEPGNSAAAFAGTWVGVKRLVSCLPAGPRCEFQSLGEETYFSTTLNQQGDAVDGSVILSEPGPLALPYGFAIKGQVSASQQLTFERRFSLDAGEPPYSGDISIKITPARRLIGRMTKHASASDSLTLVWEVEAVRH